MDCSFAAALTLVPKYLLYLFKRGKPNSFSRFCMERVRAGCVIKSLFAAFESDFCSIITTKYSVPKYLLHISIRCGLYRLNGPSCTNSQGCCQGVFMEPTLDTIPWNMADETIFPIYEKCAEHNIPILFTIGSDSI